MNNNDANDTNTCGYLATCPFIERSQAAMPGLAERIKTSYCMNNYDACARRVVSEVLGQNAVPDELMPHQSLWAEQVLTDAGKGSFIYNDRRKDGEKQPDKKK